MNQRSTGIIIGIIVIIVVVALVFGQMQNSAPATETPTPSPNLVSYTLAQVAMHPDRTSCWTTINGNVYDLTSWISRHPGGEEAILSICGKDGTQAFTTQHDSQAQPNAMLATFKIGVLAR